MDEQKILRISLIGTLGISTLGIVFGLLSGSYSIMFDGVFSLLDSAMTVLSMVVAGLIARSVRHDGLSQRLRDRFTFGFWHFEPMVLALNATILLTVMIYALLNALIALRDGGRDMAFGPAIVYAVIVISISAAIGWWEYRANRKVQSAFVAMDVRGWLMAGGVTAALLIAFAIGLMLEGTAYAWLMPYIDPMVLIAVCVLLLPVPLSSLRRAVAEIALVTPADLKARVDEAANQIVAEYGFEGFRSYVARTGRGEQIEVFFVVSAEQPPRALTEWDAIRDQLGGMIGGDTDHRWLVITFTADPARAG